MATPTRVGYAIANQPSGTTSATITPDSSLQPGMWMLLTYMAAASVTPATPAGFQLLGSQASFGTRTAAVWGGIRAAGDTSYGINYASSVNGMQAVLLWGADEDSVVANWLKGTGETRAQTGTTFDNIAPALTTVSDHTLVLALSFEATGANESNVSSITGATPWFFAPQADSSTQVHTLSVSYIDQSPPGPTGNVTIIYPNTQASNGWAMQIGIPAGVQSYSGSAALSSSGQLSASGTPRPSGSVALSSTGGLTAHASGTILDSADFSATGSLAASGTPHPSGSAAFTSAGGLSSTARLAASGTASLSTTGTLSGDTATAVEKWISTTPMYVAHRNAELDWPEETLYGFQQAAQWNKSQALEISVQRSSDGVWVCSHDQTTGRVFSGTSLDIPSNTWATLSTKTTIIGAKPIARLTDVIAAHSDRILWVDNKNTVNISEFLNLLDANGGPSRIIVKGYAGSTAYSDAARARGYKTWGFFYDADTPKISTWAPHWDLLGEDYSSTASSWSSIMAQGKPVLAHVVDTAAHRDLGTSYGAVGFMASSDVHVVPQTAAQATLSSSGTLMAEGSAVVENFSGSAELSSSGELFADPLSVHFSGELELAGAGVLSAEGSMQSSGIAQLSVGGYLSAGSTPASQSVKLSVRLAKPRWGGSLDTQRWSGRLT